MSGGIWDCVYQRIEDAACRLKGEDDPLRRAFGEHLSKCAEAMRSIEWVDSGDCSPGDEVDSIREAIGGGVDGFILAEAKKQAVETLKIVKKSLEAIIDNGPHL